MNMKLSVHVNNNSHIQIVQPEFATWKYKAKLGAEADSGDVYKKLFVKISKYLHENTCVGVVKS